MMNNNVFDEVPVDVLAWFLKYDPKWLKSGLLDEALLREQARILSLDFEHNRCAMFRHILESRVELTDDEIRVYLELTFVDSDPAMAQSARIELLMCSRLQKEQFERLAASPEFASPLMQKLATQRRLIERLLQKNLYDALFDACLASHDSVVQERLVNRTDLSQAQLSQIAVHGCNRAIRNIAQSRAKYTGQQKSKASSLHPTL